MVGPAVVYIYIIVYGWDNTATDYNIWEQQPARVTQLLRRKTMISMELLSVSEKSTEHGGATKAKLQILDIPKPADKFTSVNMISFFSQLPPFIQNSNFILFNKSNLILILNFVL